MSRRCAIPTLILAAAVTCSLRAQDLGKDLDVVFGPTRSFERGDYREWHYQGGAILRVHKLGLEIRCQNALVLSDAEEVRAAVPTEQSSGLPRRGLTTPPARRRLTVEQVRERLDRSMRAIGRAGTSSPAPESTLDLFRYLYCEGGVVVIRDGVEVMRCERLWISPIDDRIVVEQAELRYATGGGPAAQTLVVRGPRLVKQGPRWIGEDLLLTTCTAGEPHLALAVREAEIIERDGEFEVRARGQQLQLGGTNVLPVPDARFFTGSQSDNPIRSVTGGYSNILGWQAGVVLGLPNNATGGAVHEFLTGRPAHEFRGDWELGLGWIQERGFPLDGALTYGAEGVYQGRTEVFYLDDNLTDSRGRPTNQREIRRDYDGDLITATQRQAIRSQNRLFLDKDSHFDLVLNWFSDPAVYPEFFGGEYRTEEVPETSTYLHHADGNSLVTLGTRFNLSDFSYRADRALSQRFVEELPVFTYQRLAQPIATLPWQSPLVLDFETEIGQRRSDYDDTADLRFLAADRPRSDRSLRIDQLVELSAPFQWGFVSVRPYVSGRGTFYDQTVDGTDELRGAFEGGVQFATRMSRTWRWSDGEQQHAVRHVIAPRVTYRNRFRVDDRPGEFFQYDDPYAAPTDDPARVGEALNARVLSRLEQLGYYRVDALSEREFVRFELRNLLQQNDSQDGLTTPREFLLLDLAQDLFPDSGRDNGGETLGLFYFDLLVQPKLEVGTFNRLTFAVYGDNDWRNGLQTFDTEVQFGRVLGCNWALEYREDAITKGAVGVGVSTQLLDRWAVFARSQRDLQDDRWLRHSFGLRRDDHDWSIQISASYSPFRGNTVYRIDFLPHFGGGAAARSNRFDGAVEDDVGYGY
ncbi:MAG: LPS assembly protein LptD [Planctomycetota bacterium]